MRLRHLICGAVSSLAWVCLVDAAVFAKDLKLLNASYDPTRELYTEFNAAFSKSWKGKTGETATIQQSHGGSGKQARAVIDGLQADVVTLALAFDIDAIAAQGGLISTDWQKRLPHNISPYTSTVVFVVRKGNPKGIKDWDDLVRDGVTVITRNVKRHGTEAIAAAYLEHLYSPEGQEIAGRHFYRPRGPEVAAKFKGQFADIQLVTIDEAFGGWAKAQPLPFGEGGVFDQINRR